MSKVCFLGVTNSGKSSLQKVLGKNVTLVDLNLSSPWSETFSLRSHDLLRAQKIFLIFDGTQSADRDISARLLKEARDFSPSALISVVITRTDLPQKFVVPVPLKNYPLYLTSSLKEEGLEELRAAI